MVYHLCNEPFATFLENIHFCPENVSIPEHFSVYFTYKCLWRQLQNVTLVEISLANVYLESRVSHVLTEHNYDKTTTLDYKELCL